MSTCDSGLKMSEDKILSRSLDPGLGLVQSDDQQNKMADGVWSMYGRMMHGGEEELFSMLLSPPWWWRRGPAAC